MKRSRAAEDEGPQLYRTVARAGKSITRLNSADLASRGIFSGDSFSEAYAQGNATLGPREGRVLGRLDSHEEDPRDDTLVTVVLGQQRLTLLSLRLRK